MDQQKSLTFLLFTGLSGAWIHLVVSEEILIAPDASSPSQSHRQANVTSSPTPNEAHNIFRRSAFSHQPSIKTGFGV
jgi:hypothetical protein